MHCIVQFYIVTHLHIRTQHALYARRSVNVCTRGMYNSMDGGLAKGMLVHTFYFDEFQAQSFFLTAERCALCSYQHHMIHATALQLTCQFI